MSLFDKILAARGITSETLADFLSPDYSKKYNPFLLPDMDKAINRIVLAKKDQQRVVIYGDYDIDGLTAAAMLMESLRLFGIVDVEVYIPSRFIEGYGLTTGAIEKIALTGAKLIVTVDCGSQSKKEIIAANKIGIDVIVTDHHSAAVIQPPAIAVINPKRSDSNYPFNDLSGVGVAFKLVQALQIKSNSNPETSPGLPFGQEKWLLDLVALGTVCDVVSLTDENRTNVYWGLKVLAKTRRIGLSALMAVAGIDPIKLNARSLGFGLGPRMNASGRLETASHALALLTASTRAEAYEKAQYLDELNSKRQADQALIIKEAIAQAEKYSEDPVLVVSGTSWNHGIVGIVACKLLEKY
jgi:single-stranded-DNA-specific exonuclease